VRERVLLRHLLEQDVSISAAARQLGVHRVTVHRWLEAGLLDADMDLIQARYTARPRVPTKLDPSKPLVTERLEDFPELTGVRLYSTRSGPPATSGITRNRGTTSARCVLHRCRWCASRRHPVSRRSLESRIGSVLPTAR
jgi:hypothetical protein